MKRNILKAVLFTLLASLAAASSASAHRLWINVFESHAHQPPHAMVSLGWGHALPMDDILVSQTTQLELESFCMVNPSMEETEIPLPQYESREAEKTTGDMEMFAADMAARKIALKENCSQGVYQFAAVSKTAFLTSYIDKKGRQRIKLQPKDEIEDIEKVLMSFKYNAFAKSCLTVGPWKQPEPLGHGLEIVPLTDLSGLHPGDLVEVGVSFYGEPLSATSQSMDYIVAYSSGFGQSEDFFLGAYLADGKARFRVQNSGQWIVAIYHKEDVTPDGPLKDLQGKVDQVYHSASLTFTVQ